MNDALRNQIEIAEQHYNSMPADLRKVYEDEYTAASATYRRDGEPPVRTSGTAQRQDAPERDC